MRSCKKAMFAILSSRRLTEETLSTTMCRVEQVLNARPLTYASSDPDNFEALTPNNFLLGRASVSLPVGSVKPDDFNDRRVLRQSQSHVIWIWKLWFHSCTDVISGFQTTIVTFLFALLFGLYITVFPKVISLLRE